MLESGLFYLDPVGARNQIHEIVKPVGTCWLHALFAGGHIGYRHLGVGDSSPDMLSDRIQAIDRERTRTFRRSAGSG